MRQLIAEGKLRAHNLGRDYAIESSALESVKVYGKPGRPPKPKDEAEKSTAKKGVRKDALDTTFLRRRT